MAILPNGTSSMIDLLSSASGPVEEVTKGLNVEYAIGHSAQIYSCCNIYVTIHKPVPGHDSLESLLA